VTVEGAAGVTVKTIDFTVTDGLTVAAQKPLGSAGENRHRGLGPQRRAVGAQAFHRLAVAFHQRHACGAARGGLETERAAAGEQVQARGPGQAGAEPVEQRLSQRARRRAQAGHGPTSKPPTAPAPADDSHLRASHGDFSRLLQLRR